MKPHEIKCAVVSQMWRDGIVHGRQVADVSTVAALAVPNSEHKAARDEIQDWMLPSADCPVIQVSQGVITLENDRQKVREYLKRFCVAEHDLPSSLRDGV